MIYNIKNSSGKITGTTEILEDKIIIDNVGAPILEISGDVVKSIKGGISNEILLILYDEYFLSIGEIASLFNVCYSNINKILKSIDGWSANHMGRRNRAYGHCVSEAQSKRMSASLKGRKSPTYERTPEVRSKISTSLKKHFKNFPQDPSAARKNWSEGKYDKVDFKKGIAGHFTSIKNNCTFRFRSLLELYYMLQLEDDISVTSYQYEPLRIIMDNGASYMPDFKIGNCIVELKSKKYCERVSGVKEKLMYKKSQMEKYCADNNLEYKIIYDEDINFDSKRMKHYINNNPEIVKKYNITFIDNNRMVTK